MHFCAKYNISSSNYFQAKPDVTQGTVLHLLAYIFYTIDLPVL